MKKIILTAAIAAICAAPAAAIAADNNLYGQLRYSFNSIDDKDGTGLDGLSGQDNVSLFGLKGTAGDGDTKAFYHLQTGAPSDKNASGSAFNQRFYFGGLKGSWGKAAYGRMTNAYKFDGFKLDPFYNLSHVNAAGVYAAGGASYGLSPATNGFTDNSLQYHSPAFSGITVNAGVYVDDTNEDNQSTGIGATWKGKGAYAGLQYIQNTNDGSVNTNQVIPGVYIDGSAMRVHGGFKAKSWSAGLSYETVDEAKDASTNYMYLVGRFNATPKTELVLTVGTVDPDAGSANAAAEGTGYQLGVFQTVVSKTQLYVTYGAADLDAVNYEDPSVLSVGAIHKFGFGG